VVTAGGITLIPPASSSRWTIPAGRRLRYEESLIDGPDRPPRGRRWTGMGLGSETVGSEAAIAPAQRESRLVVALPVGMAWEWTWLLTLVLVDTLWCWRIGMRFSAYWLQPLAVTVFLLLGAAYRCSGRSRRIADACEVTALWIGFTVAGCILTYLFASWALPLQDSLFDRLDTALGFNWLGWRQFVEGHPLLHLLLALPYASFMPQLLLAILYFAFTGRQQRNQELFRAAFIALIITAAISGVVPALSALAFYGMPTEASWLHDLVALRGGTLSFAMPQLQGIITMPSYHAVLAVVLAWSFRRTGWLGIAIGLWNLLMLISVPSEGGHYLVDVPAGLAVAAVSVWLTHRSLAAGNFSAPAAARRP
jgi:hypothetical protein